MSFTRALKFDGYSFRSKELHCEDVALSRIAREVGTPVYVYSKAALLNRVRRLQASLNDVDCKIYFAVKACSNTHILKVLGQAGCGADIVSGGELFRASIAQIAPENIVYSGVGKSERELVEALKAQIHLFNVESLAELLLLNRLAKELGVKAPVSLRINPDVDAKTHPHISTGLKKNKFGLSKTELREVYRHLNNLAYLDFRGLSCHIGSQIMSARPFSRAWEELLDVAEKAPFDITELDLGGGLGISYENEKEFTLEEYGRLITKTFKNSKYKLGIEPGRALVGPVGVLVTTLLSTKQRGGRAFYIVDAAMNDLIRPALYGATHPVSLVAQAQTRTLVQADLVGPICETADTFQASLRLPKSEAGALLAFGHAGAYGMSMSSQYNSRPRAAEVLVDGATYHVIRSRESYADLIQHEIV
jgi:diaminopimelate decarboxylase